MMDPRFHERRAPLVSEPLRVWSRLALLSMLFVASALLVVPILDAPVFGDDVALGAVQDESDDEDQDEDADDEEDEEPEATPEAKALEEAIAKFRAVPAKRGAQGTGRRGRRPGGRQSENRERQEKLFECEDLFQRVIDDYPDTEESLDALYHLSECRRQLNRLTMAKDGFLSFIARRNEGDHVAEALHYLGHCHQDLREWEESLPVFKRVYEEFTDSGQVPACLYDAGFSLRVLQRYDEAKALWQRLIADHSSHTYATRARKKMDTLRPPRERLVPIVEEYHAVLQELRRGSARKREAIENDIVDILAKAGDVYAPESERFLLQVFNKQAGEVQAGCVKPLLNIGGKSAAEALLKNFAKLGEPSKLGILRGLKRHHVQGLSLRKTISPLLSAGAKPSVRDAAVSMLGRVRDLEAVKMLINAVAEGPRESLGAAQLKTNDNIRRSLRGLREDHVVRYLASKALKNKREVPARRVLVAEALGFSRGAEAIRGLLDVLGDPTPGLATAAVTSLGRLMALESVEAILVQLSRRGGDRDFVLAALATLSRLEARNAAQDAITYARSRDIEVRTLAVRLLGTLGDITECFEQLLAALADPAWQVRRAALTAVEDHRRVEVVDALIERLGKEDGVLQLPVVKLLISLTGQDLGPNPQDWKDYWQVARDGWEAAEVARAKSEKKGRTFVRRADPSIAKASYFGVEILSKRLAFIVDVSGSMTAEVTVDKEDGGTDTTTRIELAKSELINAVTKLRGGTHFNIVKFSNAYSSLWQKLNRLSPKSVKQATRFARGLSAAGGTNIFDSLEFVLKGGEVDTIFLLSDGAPTAGRITDPNGILDEVKRINGTKQLTIHTIALGFDSDFLRRLAEQNNGEYVVAGVRSGGSNFQPTERSAPAPSQ